MGGESNLTDIQLKVYNTINEIIEEKIKTKKAPFLVTGVELKSRFRETDIRRALYDLYKQGLIIRKEGINDYLLITKEKWNTKKKS